MGYSGQHNLINYGTDLDSAKRFFCQKFVLFLASLHRSPPLPRFADKTKNDFYFREEFIKYPGKYDYVQLDYNPSSNQKRETDENQTQSAIAAKDIVHPESKLDPRVQELIRLICNVQAMEEALLEMKFDARKNLLGSNLIPFSIFN